MTSNIKAEFGKQFRSARDAKKLSRAALAMRLGISPKTIQSWEMGRTFIENLSLIPAIEAELTISVTSLIEKSTRGIMPEVAAEAPAEYGASSSKGCPKTGPVHVGFTLHAAKLAAMPEEDILSKDVAAVPLLRPVAAAKPVPSLTTKDIAKYVVIPAEWVPRGGVLVAYRMSDSGMDPMIPLGGIVIVDRRIQDVERSLGRLVALNMNSKGVRIRRLIDDPISRKLVGVTALEGRRGKIPYREDQGDTILGRVVGVMGQPE
jgi:transcriptional regulator with XRE-family HTH domain